MPEEDVFTVSHITYFHSGLHFEALHTAGNTEMVGEGLIVTVLEDVSCKSRTWICRSHTPFFGGDGGGVVIWSIGK